MADVMDLHQPDNRENDLEGSPVLPPPPPPPRKRDRDSRERRDDRDADRHPNRRDDYQDPSRNRSPQLPLPPPPPPPRRRSSPSPPPYGHREPRHSPPRRSPPPAKRYRREDGGYDRRRGSPKGSYGDDRRYNEYGRGYDRSGRHMDRQSDWPDVGTGSHAGENQREGLMSYKQFIQELEDDILPSEAERRYEEYRSEYISTQKHAYFEAHKDEEWLKDMYHPTNLLSVIERRNENARATAREFFIELQGGKLDVGPGLKASLNNSGRSTAPNSDDEADERRKGGKGYMKEASFSAAPKAHPVSSEPRRIQADIKLAQELVRKLDSEKAILENVLATNDRDKFEAEKSHGGSLGPIIIIRGPTIVKGLEGVELLDTLLTYLWRVHGLDYYGFSEKSEPKGLRHVRPDDKTLSAPTKGVVDWEKKLESLWQDRLQGLDPLERMSAREKIDAASAEGLEPYVRKIRDEKYGWKYGCGAKGCTKLFHAAEFVHKHLRLKHPELVMDLTAKVREDLYRQNYMEDPDAPGGKPVMQQALPKDRAPRRRPISDRLRDDRGNRRGYDDSSRDFEPRNDGLEDDGYEGQGLHGAPPFPSEVPPPVLMPVPGAGPLGPFVPAPPEVAMRMLREQGGPLPFDGAGVSRGRKGGRPGQPILAVTPGFPHDPRRIRSYQDLDAPEDEVTVIDYRSL